MDELPPRSLPRAMYEPTLPMDLPPMTVCKFQSSVGCMNRRVKPVGICNTDRMISHCTERCHVHLIFHLNKSSICSNQKPVAIHHVVEPLVSKRLCDLKCLLEILMKSIFPFCAMHRLIIHQTNIQDVQKLLKGRGACRD